MARARAMNWSVLAAGLSSMALACSGEDPSDTGETGGFASEGGATMSSGGGLGAATATGGSTTSIGGRATGGAVGTGGGSLHDNGGSAAGGRMGVGGTTTAGGQPGTGGALAMGGQGTGGSGLQSGGAAGANGGATAGGMTGAGGGSTCVLGIDTTSPCDPAVDLVSCELGDRVCVCDAFSSQWTCTSNTGGNGGTAGSGTGGGDPGVGGAGGSGDPGAGGSADSGASGGGAGGGQAGSGTVGGASGIDGYNEDFEEFVGEDCDLPEPSTLSPSSHSLPDPFLMSDGSRLSRYDQWACQRAWLKKNVEAYVHGVKPGRPEVVTGSVSENGVEIHVEQGTSSADFSVAIDLPPNPSGPVPGMFQADGTGVPNGFLHEEGVAAMEYRHDAAEGAFDSINRGASVSLLVKWAWAVSRAIDVLVDERDAGRNDIIDPTALAVTGCSYAGKSAFAVGAFDERIALGIPMESGTGGLGSYRVVADRDLGPNQGEDPEQVSEACGHNWLTGTVCSGNVDSIPADAHFMVAMYAPRGFTTLDNNRIGHLGPVAQFTSDAAGAEVFKALGVESHVGYHGGNDGDPHDHCSFNTSQEETTRNAIRGFLTRTQPPANFMEPKLRNQNDQPVDYDLQDYIDWDTPTLE